MKADLVAIALKQMSDDAAQATVEGLRNVVDHVVRLAGPDLDELVERFKRELGQPDYRAAIGTALRLLAEAEGVESEASRECSED